MHIRRRLFCKITAYYTNTQAQKIDPFHGSSLSFRWMYVVYFDIGISKSRFDITDLSMIVNFTSSNIAYVTAMALGTCI